MRAFLRIQSSLPIIKLRYGKIYNNLVSGGSMQVSLNQLKWTRESLAGTIANQEGYISVNIGRSQSTVHGMDYGLWTMDRLSEQICIQATPTSLSAY